MADRYGGCVQYVFLGLDLEYATNWTDLTRALRLLAGKLIKLHLQTAKVINPYDRGTLEVCSILYTGCRLSPPFLYVQ
jgi:hypothetical protein